MSTDPELPDQILDYLARRDQSRLDRAAAMWNDLNEREQLLVKEAAVMGWVQGRIQYDVPIPSDRDIVVKVLDAADSFSDLYPTLRALGEDG